MIDICSWDHPGQDPFAGEAAAAIVMFETIPLATRTRLIKRAIKNDYDDTVLIDADSIRSAKHDYSPDLTQMHFGGAGKVCATVTRTTWTPLMVERAMVFCEDGYCIARPSVCNNWSIIRRLERAPAKQGEIGESVIIYGEAPAAVAAPSTGYVYEGVEIDSAGVPSFAGGAWSSWSGGGFYGGGGAPGLPGIPGAPGAPGAPGPCCVPCPPDDLPPVTPVPEVPTWLMLAAGVAAIGAWKRRA